MDQPAAAASSTGSDRDLDADWVVVSPVDPSPPAISLPAPPPCQAAAYERAMVQSLLVSADMAHALHPNYMEKHEDNHRPTINKGVVVKQNANQRYATTAVSTLVLREAAKRANVDLQEFVVRNDSPCGSTIGPMLSSQLGVRTIDVGNPQWSMHSIRETCGVRDVDHAVSLFKSFFDNFAEIDARIPRL
nr:hypothetical protein HK105_004446 [Polyrhizophydium stewartii]